MAHLRAVNQCSKRAALAHPSIETQCLDSGVETVSHCNVLASGCLVGRDSPVRKCALMQSAGDVYSLMVCDQLVPKNLFGTFLYASSSELVTALLVSRQSSLPRVGVKDGAD